MRTREREACTQKAHVDRQVKCTNCQVAKSVKLVVQHLEDLTNFFVERGQDAAHASRKAPRDFAGHLA
jgi:hypothetical protein